MNRYIFRYIFIFILFFLSSLHAVVECENPLNPILLDESNATVSKVGNIDKLCYQFKYSKPIGGSVKVLYWANTNVDVTEYIDTVLKFDDTINGDYTSGSYYMTKGQALNIAMDNLNNQNQEYAFVIVYTPNVDTVDDSYIVSKGENFTANVLANDNHLTNVTVSDSNLSVNSDGSFTYQATEDAGTYTYYYTATDGTDEDNATVTIQVLDSGEWPSTCYNYYYRYNDEIYQPTLPQPNVSGTFNTPDQNISFVVYIKNDDNNITIPSMSLSIGTPSELDYEGPSPIYKNTPTEPNQYFYAQLELEPQTTSYMDTLLDINLTISGHTGGLGTDIPQCGGGADANYNVQWGYFNVSSPVYPAGKYNLPTQVTQRFGEFSVSSYVADSATGIYDVPVPLKTRIGVEIIDISGTDINIACQDDTGGRSITDRVWMKFADGENNTSSIYVSKSNFDDALQDPLNLNAINTNSPEDFYKTASKNAAYRITYLATPDDELLDYENVGNVQNPKYVINNFPEIVQDIGTCVDRVLSPVGNSANSQWTIQVAVACGNAGNQGISESHLNACLECLHGKRYVCSRDNFAIRPEAFMMHLKDQNQTDPLNPTVTPVALTTLSNSGSTTASAPSPALQLAAGYAYNLEVNATNYLSNSSSPGFDSNQTLAIYEWNATTPYGFCDDTSDHLNTLSFASGATDTNSSLDQVGEYTLHILDTVWTSVDSNPTYYGHHSDTTYFVSGADCVVDSADVAIESATTAKNGCNISSQHTTPYNSTIYNNYNLRTHPYSFSINNALSVGAQDLNSTAKPFVYIANIENNESIAVHLNTTISARGANGIIMTNYTGEVNATTTQTCYAEDTLFGIGKSATTSTFLPFRYRTHDLNASGDIIVGLNDTNNSVIPAGDLTTTPSMTIPAKYWRYTQKGVLRLRTNLNFDRNVSLAVNPEDINYTHLDNNDTANTFSADLINNKYTEGSLPIGETVHHYYGKTSSPKVTILCNSTPCDSGYDYTNNTNNTNSFVYFTVYCNPKDASCVPATMLPANSRQINDIRWWTNTWHDAGATAGTDGVTGTVSTISGTTNISAMAPATSQNSFTYTNNVTSTVLPNDALLQMLSSPWLIYNENNASATRNPFEIDFVGQTGWSGESETDTSTETITDVPATNRRIMW